MEQGKERKNQIKKRSWSEFCMGWYEDKTMEVKGYTEKIRRI